MNDRLRKVDANFDADLGDFFEMLNPGKFVNQPLESWKVWFVDYLHLQNSKQIVLFDKILHVHKRSILHKKEEVQPSSPK